MDITLNEISIGLMIISLMAMLIALISIRKDKRTKKKIILSVILLCLATACTEFILKEYITGSIWTINTIMWYFNYKRL